MSESNKSASNAAALYEVLTNLLERHQSSMMTSLPAKITKVHGDGGELRVNVKPTVNIIYEDGTEEEQSEILSVPLQMPSTKRSALTLPFEVGDDVTLFFSQRSLDNFKSGKTNPLTPTDARMMDARDAIAVLGVHPFASSPNNPAKHTFPHNTKDVVLAHNLGGGSEVEIRLGADGKITINGAYDFTVNCKDAAINASNSVTVNATSYLTVNAPMGTFNIAELEWTGNVIHTGTFTSNGVTVHTHTHTSTAPTTPTSSPNAGT